MAPDGKRVHIPGSLGTAPKIPHGRRPVYFSYIGRLHHAKTLKWQEM
jgi:hypothetical protein